MDRRLSVASLVHHHQHHQQHRHPSTPIRRSSVAESSSESCNSDGHSAPSQESSPLSPALSRSGLPPFDMQATQSLTIDTQDEDVLIAVRALGDMRGTGLVGHTPRSASSSYWETNTNDGTSVQPTPSLSVASTSRVTSPSVMTHNLDEDEYENETHSVTGEPNDDFVSRVSHIPLVNAAVRVYDYSKASSRVVKYGAGLVESSVKTISRPVMDRLPVNQLDEFACRQLDRLGKYGGKPSSPKRDEDDMEVDERDGSVERGRRRRDQSTSRTRDVSMRGTSRAMSQASSDAHEDEDRSNQQVQIANRSSWQTMLLEAGGIGAAVSEESMKRLQYCLEWLQYATVHIDQQINVLRQFLVSLDSALSNDPDAPVSMNAMITLTDVKKDVVATMRQVVEVMTKYAGGALPEPARSSVRNFILLLPERWTSAMQRQQIEYSSSSNPLSPQFASHGLPGGSRDSNPTPTAVAASQAAHKVLTLATESLDMLKSVTGVFKESLDRAEAWVERLRMVGIQRQRQQAAGRLPLSSVADSSSQGWRTAPNSPGINLQTLSIESVYGTPAGSTFSSRRPSSATNPDEESESTDTETEFDRAEKKGTLRRRQRRKLSVYDDTSRGQPVKA